MSRQCDFCGMSEDHYGKNTMPLHRVALNKHESGILCDDCVVSGVKNMATGAEGYEEGAPKEVYDSMPPVYQTMYNDLRKVYNDRKRDGRSTD